jgi:putative transposase
MPRTARSLQGGYCYHVLSRGNARAEIFHDEADYAAFVRLLRRACARVPMRLLAYCLMPNHFHLALWPNGDGDVSAWMEWLLTAHVGRYRRRYRSTGHIWQGRFKAFPIAQDEHLLMVLRYIERNALRANLVCRAEDWRWSSLSEWIMPSTLGWLDAGPVARGPDWLAIVNEPQTEAELARMRLSIQRGRPFGNEEWTEQAAQALRLQFTLRSGGRPPRKDRAIAPDTPTADPGLFG